MVTVDDLHILKSIALVRDSYVKNQKEKISAVVFPVILKNVKVNAHVFLCSNMWHIAPVVDTIFLLRSN